MHLIHRRNVIQKQLSVSLFENLPYERVTVYHIETFYRDNTNDKNE